MKNLLLVENDPDIREILKYLLEKQGMKVCVARDGLEALELLEKNSFERMLTDVEMPRMNGIQLVQRIHRSEKNPIKIFVMSGNIDLLRNEILDLGVTDFFRKPFPDLNQMIRVISA